MFGGIHLQDIGTLVFDIDGDRRLTGMAELFLQIYNENGSFHQDPFDALAVFDQSDYGGNENGRIDADDLIWPQLHILEVNDRGGWDLVPFAAYTMQIPL